MIKDHSELISFEWPEKVKNKAKTVQALHAQEFLNINSIL